MAIKEKIFLNFSLQLPFLAVDNKKNTLFKMLEKANNQLKSFLCVEGTDIYVFHEDKKIPHINEIVELYIKHENLNASDIEKNSILNFKGKNGKIIPLSGREILSIMDSLENNPSDMALNKKKEAKYTPKYDLTKYSSDTLKVPKNKHTNMEFFAGYIEKDNVDFYAHWCSEYKKGNPKYSIGYDEGDVYDFDLEETATNLLEVSMQNNSFKVLDFFFNDPLSPWKVIKQEIKKKPFDEKYGEFSYYWNGNDTKALEIVLKNKVWCATTFFDDEIPKKAITNVIQSWVNNEDLYSIEEFKKFLCNLGDKNKNTKPTKKLMDIHGYGYVWDLSEALVEKQSIDSVLSKSKTEKTKNKVKTL